MSPDASRPELGSRDDIAFERLLDELRRTVASLTISVRTCRRGSDNPVFRMSAEQQFDVGLAQLTELLSLPSVAHDEEATGRLVHEMQPFLETASQMSWTAADVRVTGVFTQRTADLYAPERVKREGRPGAAFEALLSARVQVPAPEPAAEAAPGGASEESGVILAPSDEPVVLHETAFTYGDGSHHARVGGMYLAFAMHVRGMSEEDARKSLSPATLVGFAQSLDKVLAGHQGHVTFRIVRRGARVEPQLHRVAAEVRPRPA